MMPSGMRRLSTALGCLAVGTASAGFGQATEQGLPAAADGLVYTRNVVVDVSAACPHGTLRLEYLARPDVPAGKPRAPDPRILHLSIDGESLPASEIAKLDHLLSGRLVNNLWLSHCGYPGDPRFHGLISFNSRVVGDLREEHVGFDIKDSVVSLEN